MNWFNKFFAKGAGGAVAPAAQSFKEKDNRGTRQDTFEQASSYWMTRIASPKKDPFVLYTFATAAEARAALLELPCIHVAEDTQRLICTEVLTFGYYPTGEGKYEAVVCGDDLTHELWEQAKAAFGKHGGVRKNDQEPKRRPPISPPVTAPRPGKVSFVREDHRQMVGRTMTYRIHKGPDAASAKAFLEQQPEPQPLCYLVVETPQGNYCRDNQGMYKE